MLISGMRPWVAVGMITFSTIKTVCDHSNYQFPINPLYGLFANNAFYHDIHH